MIPKRPRPYWELWPCTQPLYLAATIALSSTHQKSYSLARVVSSKNTKQLGRAPICGNPFVLRVPFRYSREIVTCWTASGAAAVAGTKSRTVIRRSSCPLPKNCAASPRMNCSCWPCPPVSQGCLSV